MPATGSTDTVARGMRYIISQLTAFTIPTRQTNPLGIFNPDSNGNVKGIWGSFSYHPVYQTGMFMDAIVASGTPNAVATTGPADERQDLPPNPRPGHRGRLCLGPVRSDTGGGSRYSANQYPDNSVCQWAAIGMIAAEKFGCTVPQLVKDWNKRWLKASQWTANDFYKGAFGYSPTFAWGPYATTPSGMVQVQWTGPPRLERPELRHLGPGRDLYPEQFWQYRNLLLQHQKLLLRPLLFCEVHAAAQHRRGAGMIPSPCCSPETAGVAPLDWYAAERARATPRTAWPARW